MGGDVEQAVSATADYERKVTINQVVGYNIAQYRKAAGLKQEELGKRLGGWSKVAVSAAERSWDGKRVRKFDADELVVIARALGVPVTALFLPPAGAGTARRYVLDGLGSQDLMTLVPSILPARNDDSPSMAAYRRRLMALGLKDTEPAVAGVYAGPAEIGQATMDRHREAMAVLTQQREELERRVDDLRAFEREYRRRLDVYLSGQLRDLRAGATDDGTFPAVAGPPAAGGHQDDKGLLGSR